MIDKASQRRLMVQYLLGELSAERRAEFEDEYLKDSEIFQELVALENEMVDQYLLGALSAADRKLFERAYLADPGRRETVEAARSLLAYSAATENSMLPPVGDMTPHPFHWRSTPMVSLAAGFLVLIGGSSWLLITNHRLKDELAHLQQEQSRAFQDKQELDQQISSLRSDLQQANSTIQQMPQARPDTVSFTLGPDLLRGEGGPASLALPRRVSYVLLRIIMETASHPYYRVSIRTVEGSLIWRKDNLQSSGNEKREIAVTVPSNLLKSGDYVLRITAGGEDLAHTLAGYSFRVTRH